MIFPYLPGANVLMFKNDCVPCVNLCQVQGVLVLQSSTLPKCKTNGKRGHACIYGNVIYFFKIIMSPSFHFNHLIQ